MVVRRVLVFVGFVAAVVGLVGLVTPVRVSPEVDVISCGSAFSPDLSSARAHDDGSANNVPVPSGVVVDADYTELCRMDLEDRRLWTITLVAVGAVAVTAGLGYGLLRRRLDSGRGATSPPLGRRGRFPAWRPPPVPSSTGQPISARDQRGAGDQPARHGYASSRSRFSNRKKLLCAPSLRFSW
jgi:hypothetical protein